eukprot:CAMPEP_0173420266 /NCGR_PEP_ID=MMETSP1357-20121228/1829_1 /TAXON_ID=77926 /ORGANISM="Hemiselmis rufescens, Strain PCC563" /LENGTH=548 /DNA_ID=CAMNT_0014383045 /DNA_START=39 /DNA_END=1685 /DNA_ORIENTATION=-
MAPSSSTLALFAAIALLLVHPIGAAQDSAATTEKFAAPPPASTSAAAAADTGGAPGDAAQPLRSKMNLGGQGRRIIGGSTDTTSFPWIVNIIRIGGEDIQCTGSLVGGRWILTAAHCFHLENANSFLSVSVTNTEVKVACALSTSTSCATRRIVRAVHHPCYSLTTSENDITLLEMESDIDSLVTSFASIDNVNGTASALAGNQVWLAGFGLTNASDTNSISSDMMKVTNAITTERYCKIQNPSYVSSQEFANLLCTNSTLANGGQDSCQGDSGGPVVKTSGSTNWVVGVSSFGSEMPNANNLCAVAGRLSVNTRVAKYADFIYTTMKGQTYSCSSCPCAAPADYYSTKDGTTTPAPDDSQCEEYTTTVNTGVCAGFSFKEKMCKKPGQSVASAETEASTSADASAGTPTTCELISRTDCGSAELKSNYCTVTTGTYCATAFKEELLRTKGCTEAADCSADGVLKTAKKICCSALISQLLTKCLFTSEELEQKMVEKRNSGACQDTDCWLPANFVAPSVVAASSSLGTNLILAALAGYLSLAAAAMRV